MRRLTRRAAGRRRSLTLICSLGLVTALGSIALASSVLGSAAWADDQLLVNQTTMGDQFDPVVAAAPDGRSVVIWASQTAPGDSSGLGVVGQLFGGDGERIGGEFLVNTLVPGNQCFPSVAMRLDGSFVVAWDSLGSNGSDSSGYSIQARLFNRDAAPLTGQFQVNEITSGTQGRPDVAAGADGRFVVVWEGQTPEDLTGSVQGRVFPASGSPLDSERRLNVVTDSLQFQPSVAMAPNGDWVTTWTSVSATGTSARAAGRFVDRLGTASSQELDLSPQSDTFATLSSVAASPLGDFIAVWQAESTPGTGSPRVRAVRVGSSGSVQGSSFEVASLSEGPIHPEVTAEADRSLIVWSSDLPQGRYLETLDGSLGTIFDIGQLPSGQTVPSVDSLGSTGFVAVWATEAALASDGNGQSVQYRRELGSVFNEGFEFGSFIKWQLTFPQESGGNLHDLGL